MSASAARMARKLRFLAASLIVPLALSAQAAVAAPHAKSASGGWQDFLRSDSAPLLRGWKHPGLPAGWSVRHGVLSKDGEVDDLQSTKTYKDFELELQWKVGKASNSGIFYRATHQYDEIYWTGPEYQLVDDANTEDGKSRMTAAGSVYAMYPSPAGVIHPYGHWNSARIIVRGDHVEYFANGRKIVDYHLGSADWKKRVAASKFKAYPGYGRAPAGLIGIQGNHPGSVAIRDMRIRVLP
jgi:hypothetical protein